MNLSHNNVGMFLQFLIPLLQAVYFQCLRVCDRPPRNGTDKLYHSFIHSEGVIRELNSRPCDIQLYALSVKFFYPGTTHYRDLNQFLKFQFCIKGNFYSTATRINRHMHTDKKERREQNLPRNKEDSIFLSRLFMYVRIVLFFFFL